MGYGDLQFFDIIIFAGIAAFLVFRLRKVLGKRGGFERQQKSNSPATDIKDNTSKNTIVPDLGTNFTELQKAYDVIEGFDHVNFLNGAKIAFENIINAFNKGDKKTLKNFLTEEIFLIFSKAIDDKQNDPESQVFSLNIEKVENVKIEKDTITIMIKFISEQFKNNDENTKVKKEDTWSFEKLIKSKNPNWFLSST
tara:strand:- start:5760 stop:6347 length:588 start_codon:yes stop_codon:yes gene_type:complete